MKTTTVARGFIGAVASLLGVVAVGCSAGGWDEGAAGDEAEIGSTAQALTRATVADYPIEESMLHAHCKVTVEIEEDVFEEQMFVFGGYDTDGNGIDAAYLYSPSNDSWTQQDSITDLSGSQHNGQGRGEAVAIKLNATQCLVVGGLASIGGSGLAQAYVFDASVAPGGGSGLQWTPAGSLPSPRAQFGASVCGNGSKVVVMGGRAGNGTPISGANDVVVWSGLTTTTWTAQSVSGLLGTARHSGMFAAKDTTKFVYAGGNNGSGPVSIVEAFTATNACAVSKLGTTADLKNPANDALNLGRHAGVALFDSASDSFVVALGETAAPALANDVQEFAVNWATGVTYTDQRVTSIASQYLVRYPSPALAAAGRLILSGGEDDSAGLLASAPENPVTELIFQGATPVFPGSAPTTLSVARLGASAEFLDNASDFVFVTAGLINQTNFVLDDVTDKITP